MDIKPIETVYKGYRFRSRLEARWAVLFDAIGAVWEYEPEGFELEDGTWYLPDFRLRYVPGRGQEFEQDLWIEVKGNMTPEDRHKIELFGLHDASYDPPYKHKGHRLLVVGQIPPGEGIDNRISFMQEQAYGQIRAFNLETVDGDCFTGVLGAGIDGRPLLNDENDNIIGMDYDATEMAYRIAQQARFEHGETP